MAINYIDDNGVRQIFSDIKSNLDSINNTAVSAYDRANEAYSIASSGSITPDTQIFNIAGNKTFNINNGFFRININNSYSTSNQYTYFLSNYNSFELKAWKNNSKSSRFPEDYCMLRMNTNSFYAYVTTPNGSTKLRYCQLLMQSNVISLFSVTGAEISITDSGIYLSDGKGNSGYINIKNCI